MAYKAIVTKLVNVKKIENADKIQTALAAGNQVIVSSDQKEGELGVYFPSDGCIVSHEFMSKNNLYDTPELNFDKTKKGFFSKKGRVRVLTLRGCKSDGFWCPLSYFSFIKGYENLLVEGFEFDTLNDSLICKKYVNQETLKLRDDNSTKNKKRKDKKLESIMFHQHFDTDEFNRNMHKIFEDSNLRNKEIIITSKLHGTSQRVGHVLIDRKLNIFEKFLDKYLNKFIKVEKQEWSNLNGTRRVVLGDSTKEGYHSNKLRDGAASFFKDRLKKGETFFFEVVGFEDLDRPIMPFVSTERLKDKNFSKKYSNYDKSNNIMVYNYGCKNGEFDVYVYRGTMTNEDGVTIDYKWDELVERCKEIGVKTVPLLDRFTLKEFYFNHIGFNDDGNFDERYWREKFNEYVNKLSDSKDHLFGEHWSEGVCVRVESNFTPYILKCKNFTFKVLEQIIKESGVADIEEAESSIETSNE